MDAKVILPETPPFIYTPPNANGNQGGLALEMEAYETENHTFKKLMIAADGQQTKGRVVLSNPPTALLLKETIPYRSTITVDLPQTDTVTLEPVLPMGSHLSCNNNLVLHNGAEQRCKITAGGNVTIGAQEQGKKENQKAIPPSTGMNVTVKAGGHIVGGVVAVGSHYEAGGDVTLLRVESDHEKATCIQAKGALTLSEAKKLQDSTELSAERINIKKFDSIGFGVKISANQLTLGDKTYDLTQGSNSVKDATDKINSQYGCNITLEALNKGCDVSGNQNNPDGLAGHTEGGAGVKKASWIVRTAVGLGPGDHSPG